MTIRRTTFLLSTFVSTQLALFGVSATASAQGVPRPPPAGAAPANGALSPVPEGAQSMLPPAPPAPPPAATPPDPPPVATPPAAPPPAATPPAAMQPAAMPPPMQLPPGYIPAAFGPSRLPYVEGDVIPRGYAVATRPKQKMITAGIATFAPLYGLSLLFAGSMAGAEGPEASQHTPLFIPVIGPFITIGTSGASDIGLLTLLMDGAGQATGVALFLAGMFGEEKFLLRTAKQTFRPEVFVGPRQAALRWQF